MKAVILPDCFLDRDMLKQEFEIIDDWREADFILSGSFVNHYIPQSLLPNFDFSKLVYLTSEPAICEPRTYFYNNFHKMKLVGRYNPTNRNELPLTIDNSHGAEFPFPICPVKPVTREVTTLINKGIFLAGELSLDSDEKPHGFINIKKLRREFVNRLQQSPENYVIGKGTIKGNTFVTYEKEVRADKQEHIRLSNCDFVIAMENSIYPDYITEKLGEGFTSDRVTLYLGAPNIEKHVPVSCFVDMRKWFDTENKQFNFDGFFNYLKGMTQQEYDSILNNAREFRKDSDRKFRDNQIDLTRRVIQFLKDNP